MECGWSMKDCAVCTISRKPWTVERLTNCFRFIIICNEDIMLFIIVNNFDGLYLQVDKRGKRVAKWRT